MNIIPHQSPNFDERASSIPLQYIVLHYTGMKTGAEALQRLCDSKSKVSAHYVIEEDGRIFKLVDEDKRAWHAGLSSWHCITDMNSASIGIELVNPGHQFGYRAFPDIQIASLKKLLQDIINRHSLNPQFCLVAHADIAPERKEDPGELFPWEDLATSGLGLWPKPEPHDYRHAEDSEVQTMLRALGYNCPTTGSYDRETRPSLLAFQRHFESNNLTGTPERETIARLRALVRKVS